MHGSHALIIAEICLRKPYKDLRTAVIFPLFREMWEHFLCLTAAAMWS